jgi:hypothetical protein
MLAKEDFYSRVSFQTGDEQMAHFWGDTWLGDMSLASQYLSLYNTVQCKNALVVDVLPEAPLNI